MKSISAIHPAITKNTESILVKHAPHISIRESHNASISAMSNSFHNIVSKAWYEKCLSDLYVLHRSYYMSTANRHLNYSVVKKEWDIKGVQKYSTCQNKAYVA